MPVTDPGSASKADLAASTEPGEEVTPATIKEAIVGDGTMGVINSFADSTFSENDVYSNPVPVVLYNTYDLDHLSDNVIGIVVETFPYTRTWDENNDYIDNYSTVSDFAAPTVEQVDSDASVHYGDAAFYINITTATYAEDEIAGLQDKFGAPVEFDPSVLYKSTIESLAAEVSQTFTSKRYVFKKKASTRIRGENLSSTFRFTRQPTTTGSADPAAASLTPVKGTTLTSTSTRGILNEFKNRSNLY